MRNRRKGVSDIIGNILILSITVTLFSTLFYWVGTLPAPTPSVSTQFTASIITNSNTITEIQITDLGGSPLYNSSTIIYISYQLSPQNNKNYYISSGMLGNPNYNGVWLPGMVWSITTNVPSEVSGSSQVVTINIVDVSKNQLVWSNQYPLYASNLPPIINAEGTIPNMPIQWGESFQVWASVYEPQRGVTITSVVLSIPLFGVNAANMGFDNTHYIWISSSITTYPTSYISSASASITATNSNGQQSSIVLTIQFTPPPPPQAPNLWVSEIAMYDGNGEGSPFGGYGNNVNLVNIVIQNGGYGVAYTIYVAVYYYTYERYLNWQSDEWGTYCSLGGYQWAGWWIWSYNFYSFAPKSISTVSFLWWPDGWNIWFNDRTYNAHQGGWVNINNYFQISIWYYDSIGNEYYYQWGGAFVASGPGNTCP
ncbi:MAG: type IV pilin [Thermoplasmata archaeon]